ncbi:uncharacterized protein LOC118463078 [Anopheles albimanus]|nr:uncharacterized protein LOC118463078 [Anopheles albimanus]XP_035785233.1 uncharacterized protein LOC118463078 [Anopheles albimanus]XP_035785234.1 uncharacterized protein LOC118463078 [Anopheles albimanus]
MEINELQMMQFAEEIIQPFAISCVDDMMTISTKEHTCVLQLKYRHLAEDNVMNYEFSRIKCSTEKPTGRLNADEIAIYRASSREERRRIMLDQTLFPYVAKVYINSQQSWPSPQGIFIDTPREQLVASLTNLGQLTIYRQDGNWLSNWQQYVNLSECWMQHVYNNRVIEAFEELRATADDVLITSFCWPQQVRRHPLLISFGTKSGKLVICHLLPTAGVEIVHVHQEAETPVLLKHVTMKTEEENLLVVGLQSGRVALYKFRSASQLTGFNRMATLFEEDIPITAIECEIDHEYRQLLLVVVKGTYILALQASFDGKILASTTLDLENFMITGLQQLKKRQYVACTMPGALFHVSIVEGARLTMEKSMIKNRLNIDSYALYGLAASRNRACWTFVAYPSRRFDHLGIRYPTVIFLAKFTHRNAMEILLANETRLLTDFYDAAEVVRFDGSRDTDVLSLVEQSLTHAGMNVSDPYYLKLRMTILGAKIARNKKRSMAITDGLITQYQFICSLLQALSACTVLNHLTQLAADRPLNKLQQLTFRCLRRFTSSILEEPFPEGIEDVEADAKEKLRNDLSRSDRLCSIEGSPPTEMCTFCDAAIDESKGTCADDHVVLRCLLTKVQIPIEELESICPMCQQYCISADRLMKLLATDRKPPSFDYRTCHVCDVLFASIK